MTRTDRPVASSILAAAARIQSHLEHVCAGFGITLAQYNVLSILKGGPEEGFPRREIVCRMIQPSADCTRLIDRLEKMGLVTRNRTVADRRLSLTKITPQGRALLSRMESTFRTAEEEIAKKIPDSEQSRFSKLLQQFL